MQQPESSHSKAYADVLRINANLSRAMRFHAPKGEVEILRHELREARLVLAFERGIKPLPFQLVGDDWDFLIGYIKQKAGHTNVSH